MLKLRLLLALFLLVLGSTETLLAHSFSGSADAESNPPEEEQDPEPENCEDGDSGTAADPVDLFTGAQRFSVTDMVVPGPFPIKLSRHYNSQSRYDSVLGYGWSLNHDKHLYEYADGSVIIRFNCGIRQKFVKGQDSGNRYEVVDGTRLRGSLVQESNGYFTFTHLKGWQESFDTLGRLVRRQRPDGLSHHYSYSDSRYPVVGVSPYSITPDKPITTSRHYRLLSVRLHLADDTAPGQGLSFTYDEVTGRLKTVSDQSGRTVAYLHDVVAENSTQGNLLSVTGLAGRLSRYEYNDPNDKHNITFIQHRQSEASAVNSYDDQDRVIGQVWGETEYVFNYDDSNLTRTVSRLLKVGDATEALTDSYTFNSDARVIQRVYADGTQSNYTFNTQRRVTAQSQLPRPAFSFAAASEAEAVDSESESAPDVSYDYDTMGRKVFAQRFINDTDVITETWAYDSPLGLVTEIKRTSSVAPETVYHEVLTYDATFPGRLIKRERYGEGDSVRTTGYRYFDNGLLEKVVLPNQDELRYSYNDKAQLHQAARYRDDALVPETVQVFSYDNYGFIATRADAATGLTQLTNDALGRPVQITNALGENSLYTYSNDVLSRIERGQTVIDDTVQRGTQTQIIYDDYQRQSAVAVMTASGEWQLLRENTYDNLNRLVAFRDGEGRAVYYGYDARDRRISEQVGDNEPSVITYDSLGRVQNRLDPLKRSTDYVYDLLGRLLAIKDPEGGITALRYNVYDQVVSVTDAVGSTTIFSYNSFGEKVAETRPTLEQTRLAYDSLGRRVEQVYPGGQVFRYAYTAFDALSQVEVYENADATTPLRTEVYAYNSRGLLASVADTGTGGEQYRYSYDALGRQLSTSYSYLPFAYQVAKTYNAYGQVDSITRTQGDTSEVLRYHYDERTVLTSANIYQQNISLEYNQALQESAIKFPNITEQRSYDGKTGMMIGQNFSVGTDVLEFYTLGYDTGLNLTSLISQRQGSRSYDYSALERLTKVTAENALVPNEAYAYDGVGNRTGEGYSYDKSHRLLGAPELAFTYDADGNMLTRGSALVMTYDKRNRLSTATQSGVTTGYQYDVFNRRLSKATGDDKQYFIWEDDKLSAEYSTTGSLTRAYAYLPGQWSPALVKTSTGVYQVHNNYLDTPVFVTDNTAKVVWQAQSTAFGEVIVNNDVDGDGNLFELPMRLPGQYYDQETGLNYNWHRYYEPTLGRYIQSDPIGLRGGLNTYGYALQNPLFWIDPLGLTVTCTYSQATGRLRCTDDSTGQETVNEVCYSGAPGAVNDGSQQNTPDVGPIPVGGYDIGNGVGNRGTGPQSLPLTPSANNNQFPSTRDPNTFLMHGDNALGNQSASQGCIICSRNTRNIINAAGGGSLTVQ